MLLPVRLECSKNGAGGYTVSGAARGAGMSKHQQVQAIGNWYGRPYWFYRNGFCPRNTKGSAVAHTTRDADVSKRQQRRTAPALF
jgi:hypothetical protein